MKQVGARGFIYKWERDDNFLHFEIIDKLKICFGNKK